jgi:hypothetical protein
MIRLELTIQESDFLQQWLLSSSHPAPQQAEQRRQLLDKVIAARQRSLQEQLCPVCNQPFTQLKRGRTGRYCSSACRQKAYRQRVFERIRRRY